MLGGQRHADGRLNHSGLNMFRIILVDVPRILLGLLFLVSGIDGLLLVFTGTNYINPPTSPDGLAFEHALKMSGFFWPLMKTINLVGAILLLSNRAPALGVALLLPIITVIIGFHVALNPGGIPIAVALALVTGLLIIAYRDRYAALLA
jgi:putative oxidoreductase